MPSNWTVVTAIPAKRDPEVDSAIDFIDKNLPVGSAVALDDPESILIAKKAIKHIKIDNDAARFVFKIGGDGKTYLKKLAS